MKVNPHCIYSWTEHPIQIRLFEILNYIKIHIIRVSYYGIAFNSNSLKCFYKMVKYRLLKWLNRRGGKAKINRNGFSEYVEKWNLLLKLYIKHSYLSLMRI